MRCDPPTARTWRGTLLNYLVGIAPPRCLHCHRSGSTPEWLCAECRAGVSGNASACHRCGLPNSARCCDSCSAQPPTFARTIAPLTYSPAVRALIHRWKFKGHTGLTPYLTELAGELHYTQADTPDVIVPVPPHWARRLYRGFDQTWLLANDIARRHPKRPAVQPLLQRHRKTSPQRQLSGDARIHNTAAAFNTNQSIAGKHVALVDDVMTTGATVNACAQTLLAAGASRVDVWCLVRVASPVEEV